MKHFDEGNVPSSEDTVVSNFPIRCNSWESSTKGGQVPLRCLHRTAPASSLPYSLSSCSQAERDQPCSLTPLPEGPKEGPFCTFFVYFSRKSMRNLYVGTAWLVVASYLSVGVNDKRSSCPQAETQCHGNTSANSSPAGKNVHFHLTPPFLRLVKRILFRILKGHSSRQRRQKHEEPVTRNGSGSPLTEACIIKTCCLCFFTH